MRQAMFTAECGDDVWGEDETVKLLERRAATLTNKKAALWVPTGTMGNLTALLSHCSRRGEEAIVGRQSHIYQYEAGGASVLGGIAYNVVDEEEGGGPAGTLRLAALRAAVRRPFGGGGGYGGGIAPVSLLSPLPPGRRLTALSLGFKHLIVHGPPGGGQRHR